MPENVNIYFEEQNFKGNPPLKIKDGTTYSVFRNESGDIYVQTSYSEGAEPNSPSPDTIQVSHMIALGDFEFKILSGPNAMATIQDTQGTWTFLRISQN